MAETQNSTSKEMSNELGEEQSNPLCHTQKFELNSKVIGNTGELLNTEGS